MKIGRYKVITSKWPWQQDRGVHAVWSRFGAGWDYKLGISLGGNTLLLDLVWGQVRIVREGVTD